MTALLKPNEKPHVSADILKTDHERARSVAVTIRIAERKLRARLPMLNYQNTLGMFFLAAAFLTIAASSIFYLQGIIPAWLCILFNGLGFSILREIEHDLIHNLYFRGKTALQYVLMFIIWPFMGNYPNPVARRRIHLLHHRTSGEVEDFEERLIGNGRPYGPVRILAMLDTFLSLPFRVKELRSVPGFSFKSLLASGIPVVYIFQAIWYTFLLYHGTTLGATVLGVDLSVPAWLSAAMTILNPLVVVWVIPNVLRQLSLAILSSNNHYFGDVDGLLNQTQVFNAWYFLPLQILTFNFGSTHAIHHFVAGQPFYLRQMVASVAHRAMQENGVRFNDLGSVLRANRYQIAE